MCFEDMESKVSKKCRVEDQKSFKKIFMDGTIAGLEDTVMKHCESKNYPYNHFFGSCTSGLKQSITYQFFIFFCFYYIMEKKYFTSN